MATKKPTYPLRVQPETLDALRRWADDELRSVNAQIDYLLRKALREAGRLPGQERPADPQPGSED